MKNYRFSTEIVVYHEMYEMDTESLQSVEVIETRSVSVTFDDLEWP